MPEVSDQAQPSEVTRNPGQFIDVCIIWLCQMMLFFAVERRRLKSMILQILKNDVKVETVKTLSPSLRDCVDGISVCMYVRWSFRIMF